MNLRFACLCLAALIPLLAGAAAPDGGRAGAESLDVRLDRWIGQVRAEDAGSPPWAWKEFEPASITNWPGAIDRLTSRTPIHNPVVRYWLAAARVAAGAPEAEKQMAAARTELEKYLPEKAAAADRALAGSFKAAGVKYALRMLLEDAARELRVCEERELGRCPNTPAALAEFLQLTGWFAFPGGHADDLAIDCRCWLEEYYDRLAWDANRKRFIGAPAPGPELLDQFARTYGMEVDPKNLNDSGGQLLVLGKIVAIMQANAEAAKDPNAAELVLGMIEPAWVFNSQQTGEKVIYLDLPKTNRELGVRLWSRWLLKHLRPIKVERIWTLSGCLGPPINKYDYALVADARRAILPRLQGAYAAARGQPLEVRFPKTMAFLYAGGPVPLEEAKGLLTEAGRDGKLGAVDALRWVDSIVTMGQFDGLDLLLHLATVSPVDARKGILGRFEHRTTMNQQNRMHYDEKGDMVAWIRRYQKWLESRRATMTFKPGINRFESAAPEQREKEE